jgi:small subunit ribosomal protein S21
VRCVDSDAFKGSRLPPRAGRNANKRPIQLTEAASWPINPTKYADSEKDGRCGSGMPIVTLPRLSSRLPSFAESDHGFRHALGGLNRTRVVIQVKYRGTRNAVGEKMVKLMVRDSETIQEAVRRFRKLVERSGIKKEMRRREHYQKPSEIRRRQKIQAERRNKRARLLGR